MSPLPRDTVRPAHVGDTAVTVFPTGAAGGFPLGPVIAPGVVTPSPPPHFSEPVPTLVPAGALPARHRFARRGSWGASALAALAVVACCWSVAELSGAWSRAVPVVSAGVKPIAEPTPPPAEPVPTAAEVAPPHPLEAGIRPGENPLSTLGLPVTGGRCRLPSYSAQRSLDFLTAAVDCFDHVWGPALTATRSSGPPVRLRVGPPTGPGQPCGPRSGTELAGYCEGTIYLGQRAGPDSPPLPVTALGGYLEAVAHSYGRHLQRLSGIEDAGSRLRVAVGSEGAGGPALTRREELQATCLAGMTIAALVTHGALSATVREQITRAAAARGDSPGQTAEARSHGSTESNQHWFTVGYHSTRPTSCNTWLASPAQVN